MCRHHEITRLFAAPLQHVDLRRPAAVIRQHPECISAQVERCIEKPEQYILINIWTSLEAHTKDFRGGPLFPQWRSHINGLFEANPTVFHYQPF